MRSWKLISAIALSLVIHLGTAVLLLPDEFKPQIAGGEELASLSIGEESLNALMSGAPTLEAVSEETEPTEPIENQESEIDPSGIVKAETVEPDLSNPIEEITSESTATSEIESTQIESDPVAIMESTEGEFVQVEEDTTSQSETLEAVNSSSTKVEETAIQNAVPTPRPQRKTKKPEAKKPAIKKPTTAKPTNKKKKNTSRPKKTVKQKSGHGGNTKASSKKGSSGKKSSKSQKKGNAAVSNYPGKVYSKIARTRRKSAGANGKALVRFSISNGGGLSGVSIARSSGNKKLDNAAISHVRRAAPFPKPPAGAKRTFVIPIQFKR